MPGSFRPDAFSRSSFVRTTTEILNQPPVKSLELLFFSPIFPMPLLQFTASGDHSS